MSLSLTNFLRTGAVAGLGAATLFLGACAQSSTPPIARAAQGAPGTPSAAPTADTEQQTVQKYVASTRAYAVCARAAGIDMPDPDASGVLHPPAGLKQKVMQDPAKKTALDACSKKLLSVPASLQYPDLTPKEFDLAKKLAVCMRAHGVPSYPDPTIHTNPNQSNPSDTTALSQLISTQAYQRAINTCNLSVYGQAGVG